MADPTWPAPFVVGVGRSGTTLLRSILDSHPALAVAHESRFLGWMVRHPGRYEAAGGFDVRQFLADALGENPRVPSRVGEWDLDLGAVREEVTAAAPTGLSDAVRLVFGAYAESRHKERYGDKTPGYVQCVPELAALLPEARFVHLVRDGRDVALAMLDVDFGGVSIPHAAWLWATRLERARAAGAVLGAERYLELRYEDLVAAPEATVQQVCGFVELDYQPAMLSYFERRDLTAGLAGQDHHGSVALPVTAGLRDWRRQMPGTDVAAFEAVAGEALEASGYELTVPADRRSPVRATRARLRVAQGRAVASWRGVRRRRGWSAPGAAGPG